MTVNNEVIIKGLSVLAHHKMIMSCILEQRPLHVHLSPRNSFGYISVFQCDSWQHMWLMEHVCEFTKYLAACT